MGQGKRYTEAFKQKVLADWEKGTSSSDEICEKYEIARSALYNWKSKAKKKGGFASPIIHVDSEVVKMKEALRKALFANYLAETGIDLN